MQPRELELFRSERGLTTVPRTRNRGPDAGNRSEQTEGGRDTHRDPSDGNTSFAGRRSWTVERSPSLLGDVGQFTCSQRPEGPLRQNPRGGRGEGRSRAAERTARRRACRRRLSNVAGLNDAGSIHMQREKAAWRMPVTEALRTSCELKVRLIQVSPGSHPGQNNNLGRHGVVHREEKNARYILCSPYLLPKLKGAGVHVLCMGSVNFGVLPFSNKSARRIFPTFFRDRSRLELFLRSPCSTSSTSRAQRTCSVSAASERRHRVLLPNVELFRKFEHQIFSNLPPCSALISPALAFFHLGLF